MRRCGHQLLAGLAGLLVTAGAPADNFESAREWLERMATAMTELTYQGTFVYMRGQEVETMRITHVNDSQGVRERMVALSGPHREVIRDADGVQCVLDEDGMLGSDPSMAQSLFPEIPIDELSLARSRYLFEVGDLARIAGHRGRRIGILPRDEFRYGYDFWLEKDTGLLLRWVVYDATRRPLAKLMFTDLVIGDGVDAAELATDTPAEAFVRLGAGTPDTVNPARLEPRWKATRLPPGFELAALSHGPAADADRFEHLVLSDGLASVSVYIEQFAPDQAISEGLSRMGTTNAFSRKVGRRQITVVGEVPVITVRAISSAFAKPVSAAQ